MTPNTARGRVKSADTNFGNYPIFDMGDFEKSSGWIGWSRNEFSHRLSPQPPAVGAGRSAFAVRAARRRWLTFFC
jgi:hypothetical protein